MRNSLILLACVSLSACGTTDLRPPERAASEDVQLYHADLVDSSREFEKSIVGQRLKGDGMDLTVSPDGVLVGTNLGRPFVGGWEYRKGILCTSLTQIKLKRAADKQCFYAAVQGREVLLVPVDG